ncbi:Methionyl-tRNA formyltransferase [Gimesia panareensis]|uniref:Methionyl-tRNA formyltransferase n=1 Tax=Gimesia panareensis TaxID=2527978 RepID=A0A518FWT2_9PLAN|nr:methionyl-tRNA formyltransferase [Gimesia panareensis]QDV20838.1 Methionyl-tRNA formyltransferase [Gimesia panareensis]
MPLKVVMMGTGTFAIPAFQALLDSEHEVLGLYTQPDRTGRGHHRHKNPMKELALEHNIPVFQPPKINTPESLEELEQLQADVYLVAAYGQILSQKLLDLPRCGAFNLHASLLPHYRGAAPILYAIRAGETRTGVSVFRIERSLDSGPIAGMVETEIGSKETTGQLQDRLADLAAPLAMQLLTDIEAGTLVETPQNHEEATFAPTLDKQVGAIDWSQTAQQIACHVRAMQPWPSPFSFLQHPGQDPLRLQILDVDPLTAEQTEALSCDVDPGQAAPGTVVFANPKRVVVSTGEGLLEINQIQPQGKRAMQVSDFLCGRKIHPGDIFGEPAV